MNKLPLFSSLRRKFHVSFKNRHCNLNPIPELDQFSSEDHAKHIKIPMYFLLCVVIPIASAALWYQEYEHRVAHPHRIKAPKHDFLHNQIRPYSWGDGDKSPLFHPYWNFTKDGYITDKEGNLLPPGTFVDQ